MSPAIAMGFVMELLIRSILGVDPRIVQAGVEIAVGALNPLLPEGEGRRAIQFQRQDGIVFGEALILVGAAQIPVEFYLGEGDGVLAFHPSLLAFLSIVAGAILLAVIVPRFLKHREEHRSLARVAEHGEPI